MYCNASLITKASGLSNQGLLLLSVSNFNILLYFKCLLKYFIPEYVSIFLREVDLKVKYPQYDRQQITALY